MKRVAAVYQIKNVKNGKFYIGSTANFYSRKAKHLNDLRKNKHHSIILQHAYVKYGESSFVFNILENISELKTLTIREQHYLDIFKPEYNVSYIASEKTRLGMKSSPEHCAHMSAALKGRVSPMKGKKFSDEHKRKISEANTGNKNCLGHRHTNETKEKLRLHHNKKSNGPRSAEFGRAVSERFKKWHASLSAEEKQKRSQQTSLRFRMPPLILECAACHKKFVAERRGSADKKRRTCSPGCTSELRRQLLTQRIKADPMMCFRAGKKSWALKTEEDKINFSRKVSMAHRMPARKTLCSICNKEVVYRPHGTKIPRTCGSTECLSERRKRNLAVRWQRFHEQNKFKGD